MSLENDRICPEDVLGVILAATKIPDGAKVTKVKGTKDYVFRRELKVHHLDQKPLVIDGLFLFDSRGNVNQVSETTELVWLITADELVDDLRRSWEPPMQ